MITEPTPSVLEMAVKSALAFREQHDELEVGGLNRGKLIARVKDPMRIDKFLRAGVIDEGQYAAGFYFTNLYALSHRSEITLSAYSGLPKEAFAQRVFAELGIIGKVASCDLYHKVFRLMTPHLFRVAFMVCINELSLSEVAACFKIRKENTRDEIRKSLDELGIKLDEAREVIMLAIDSGNQK